VGGRMKVQKIVSLDETTMKISQRMDNFSQWVRIGLRDYVNDNDIASETLRRIHWAKAAHLLAAAMVEHGIELDPEYKGTVNDLVNKAYAEAKKQRTLEEFE
jgi:hypothetical protein